MGVGGQRHAPAVLPQQCPGIHCTGSWMSPRAGLDGCGKYRPSSRFDARTVQLVANRYTDWAIPAHVTDKTKYLLWCHNRWRCCNTTDWRFNHLGCKANLPGMDKIEEDTELTLMFTSIQHFIGNGQGFVSCQCKIKYDSQKCYCVKINVPCQS